MDITETFKALADPARLEIVCMLAEKGEMCVCEIVPALGMGQPAVSHHLARLRYAGLIKPRKQGQWIHYSLNLDMLEKGVYAFIRQLVETAKLNRKEQQKCCASSGLEDRD